MIPVFQSRLMTLLEKILKEVIAYFPEARPIIIGYLAQRYEHGLPLLSLQRKLM